jgi:hypothetical protein
LARRNFVFLRAQPNYALLCPSDRCFKGVVDSTYTANILRYTNLAENLVNMKLIDELRNQLGVKKIGGLQAMDLNCTNETATKIVKIEMLYGYRRSN